ncbi:MAG: DUF3300 domain-containing protein [Candidatus Binatia bacterium]|nr:DUF3300 domain-containing protein [Candidatus Binatia bacterium]
MQTLHLSRSAGVHGLALFLAFLVALPPAWAQSSGSSDSAPLSTEQLEQLVAPIALYPDSLVAQVLMASTYPLEVVEAARWVKSNPDLKEKALEDALEKQSWDASVKSLTAFPQALDMMNDKLDWTTQLGDAFLAQQKDVMNSVQVLRGKAKKEGNLESNQQQTVKVENAPTGTQTQTIIIEPADPQIVYVPTYNPTVVYGAWPYPAYPPFYYYPPGYAFIGSTLSFGVGLAVGGALWGGCNWGRSNVNVNVNKYNNFNKTNINNSNWNHNSDHRKGVSYRDQSSRDKYGGDRSAKDRKSRDSFRGRADQGRKDIASGGADKFKGKNGRSGAFGGAGQHSSRGSSLGGSNRSSRGGAFQGGGNGNSARRNSDRGRSSRGSSFNRGGGGGGHSFGGGGGRGGGGRGGGGRGGGGRGGGGRRGR